MTIRSIRGKWYRVLADTLHSNSLHHQYHSHTRDTIVIDDSGDVIFLREMDYLKPHWSIQDVRNEIEGITNATHWRSEERRMKTLQYYRDVLNIMIGYQRNQTIDVILRNEDYNDTLCLAC